jgi:aspartate/methionine/tyrosine aminotransferase
LRLKFSQKRKILEKGLLSAGIEPLSSNGGFFLMAKLPIEKDIIDEICYELELTKNNNNCNNNNNGDNNNNDDSYNNNNNNNINNDNINNNNNNNNYINNNINNNNIINNDIEPYDWKYCKKLALKNKVIAIPASPFFSSTEYEQKLKLPPLARFAFCKEDEALNIASERLSMVKNINQQNVI